VKIVSKLSTSHFEAGHRNNVSPKKDIFSAPTRSAVTAGLCVRSDRKENRIFNGARGGKYEDRRMEMKKKKKKNPNNNAKSTRVQRSVTVRSIMDRIHWVHVAIGGASRGGCRAEAVHLPRCPRGRSNQTVRILRVADGRIGVRSDGGVWLADGRHHGTEIGGSRHRGAGLILLRDVDWRRQGVVVTVGANWAGIRERLGRTSAVRLGSRVRAGAMAGVVRHRCR
jgi:hypothetical protein